MGAASRTRKSPHPSTLWPSTVRESEEPEVKMQSLTMLCPGQPDLILPIPFGNNSKRILFTLKEGSQYRLKFSFTGSNNIVMGLKYTNVVWKTGMKVDNSKRMLGTFSPQQEPYTCEMEEETTPSSTFARGTYSARTKVNQNQVIMVEGKAWSRTAILNRPLVLNCLSTAMVALLLIWVADIRKHVKNLEYGKGHVYKAVHVTDFYFLSSTLALYRMY